MVFTHLRGVSHPHSSCPSGVPASPRRVPPLPHKRPAGDPSSVGSSATEQHTREQELQSGLQPEIHTPHTPHCPSNLLFPSPLSLSPLHPFTSISFFLPFHQLQCSVPGASPRLAETAPQFEHPSSATSGQSPSHLSTLLQLPPQPPPPPPSQPPSLPLEPVSLNPPNLSTAISKRSGGLPMWTPRTFPLLTFPFPKISH